MPDSEPFGTCPKCGSPIIERFKSFTCTNEECDFTVWKTIAGRLLSREEFETLVRDKQVGPLSGFRSRKGTRFPAVLKLSNDFKAEFDFGPNGQENGACATGRFLRKGAAWRMSKVWRARVRVGNELHLRKFSRPQQERAIFALAKLSCNNR